MLRAKQPFLFPLHYSKKKKIGSVTSRGKLHYFSVLASLFRNETRIGCVVFRGPEV